MKAVILAGGLGTRIAEESMTRPKPLVEIGGRPILWHIMKIYAAHGINDFIICLGYKGYMIKEYFSNYALHMSNITVDMRTNKTTVHQNSAEPWKVTLLNTGEDTMTGGRLKRIRSYLGDEDFCCTYGDGVADVNISRLLRLHKSQKTLATVTAVQPQARFGSIESSDGIVTGFREKPVEEGGWVNAGFFVLSPKVLEGIGGDETVWEKEPLESLAKSAQLSVFKHHGFWHPLDTLRDKQHLEYLWREKKAAWKVWGTGSNKLNKQCADVFLSSSLINKPEYV